MNEIIKSIEDAQLKEVAEFNVGDTVRSRKETVKESRSLKEPF